MSSGELVIECIFYDGLVARTESDEHVQLINLGTSPVDLKGWKLADVADGAPEFVFGESYQLGSGERVRVYTNQVHQEWGGFSFGAASSIWNNSNPDTAGLFNPGGVMVSEKSYPPGC